MDLHSIFIEPLEDLLSSEDYRRILPGSRLVFHSLITNPEKSFSEIQENEGKFDILIASHVFTKFGETVSDIVEESPSSKISIHSGKHRYRTYHITYLENSFHE